MLLGEVGVKYISGSSGSKVKFQPRTSHEDP